MAVKVLFLGPEEKGSVGESVEVQEAGLVFRIHKDGCQVLKSRYFNHGIFHPSLTDTETLCVIKLHQEYGYKTCRMG